MGLADFNAVPESEARAALQACLPVDRWVTAVAAGRPYASAADALAVARDAAAELDDAELAAALAGHPRIGERASSSAHSADHSRREQAGVDRSDDDLMRRLAEGNSAYEDRFDRVFLIRAKGRDATEILAELQRRLHNDEPSERTETVTQLREIALLRLQEVVS